MSDHDAIYDRGRERPDVTLTHIPASNDPDDSRQTLAAQSPTPEARRVVDCIAWQGNPDHDPGHLLHDVKRWFAAYLVREGVGATYDFAAVAVAAYLLGRRDGVLTAAVAAEDPPAAGARAIAFSLAWLGGFVCALLIGIGGFILSGR